MFHFQVYSELTENLIDELVNIQARVFAEPFKKEKLQSRLSNARGLLSIHAYRGPEIVGFKTGYELAPSQFYSWIGGVDPSARGSGLGRMLMHEQHRELAHRGYNNVLTKTENRFKNMLILNLKCGFEITATLPKEGRGLQIVLEKVLN